MFHGVLTVGWTVRTVRFYGATDGDLRWIFTVAVTVRDVSRDILPI